MTAAPAPPGMPVPAPDRDTTAFWEAAAEQRLVMQHCRQCGEWIWLPRPLCPRCHDDAPPWEQVPGDAVVASWIVVHPPVLPAFAGLTPFVVALMELRPQGVRMVGNLVDDAGRMTPASDHALDGLAIGAPARLRWRTQGAWTLPAWTLAPAARADQGVAREGRRQPGG